MTDNYDKACALVIENDKASTSWLQRQLRLGYNEAARLIERMEADGVVGPPDNVGRREVLGAKGEPSPWDRNAGRYDVPTTAKPQPDAVGGPTSLDPALDGRALRGVDAISAAEPIAIEEADGAERSTEDVGVERLMQIVERLEALAHQRSEITSIMADVRAFAKACGYEPKAITELIRQRAQDPDQRKAFEAILEVYRHAAGIEGPEFVIALPRPAIVAAPPPKRLTAREKQYREVLALTTAERSPPSGGIFE